MRSLQEIRYRLRQEAANLFLLLRAPAPNAVSKSPLELLPDPSQVAAGLKNSPFAAEVDSLATGILCNRIPLLGSEWCFDGPIPWRRDWKHNREFGGTPYFRLVPYLDFNRTGDHKFIWELNRHQYFVVLAQASLLSGRFDFLETLQTHWESWVAGNPFQRGINWTSALEVAFRALSWTWVYHLVGDRLPDSLRQRFLTELCRHGYHLEYNLSLYFSPNTHLLGEAVALHALGVLFPEFPRAGRWAKLGASIVEAELIRQVRSDGAHFEQSSYYHIYALDFFLFHYLLAGRPHQFEAVLIRMAEYLDAMQGPSRRIFFVGDDDGGRVFHPYGERTCFGRATLATCAVMFRRPEWLNDPDDLSAQAAWWLGASAFDVEPKPRPAADSKRFADSGTIVSESKNLFAVCKAGGFGPFRAGHTHSDSLSVSVRRADRDVLIDPGTFNYSDPEWRDWFRASAAHNTVRVDGLNQAATRGPFGWAGKPEVKIREWTSAPDWDYLDATCRYDRQPFTHRRRLLVRKDLGWLIILDSVTGPGEHCVEQFWNCAGPVSALSSHAYQLGDGARLLLDPTMQVETQDGWRSPVYGQKLPSQRIVASRRGALPVTFAAAVVGPGDDLQTLRVTSETQVSIGSAVFGFPPRTGLA